MKIVKYIQHLLLKNLLNDPMHTIFQHKRLNNIYNIIPLFHLTLKTP